MSIMFLSVPSIYIYIFYGCVLLGVTNPYMYKNGIFGIKKDGVQVVTVPCQSCLILSVLINKQPSSED